MKKFDQLNQQEARIKKEKIAKEKSIVTISPKVIIFLLLILAALAVGAYFVFRDTSNLKPTAADIQAANSFVKNKSGSSATPEPTIEPEYSNAVDSAKRFLKANPYSYKGLIEQLTGRGYAEDVAKYGAANCGADWNEQATRRAQVLVKENNYSHEELVAQLESDDGFTHAQAEYGASNVNESLTTYTPAPTDIPPEYSNAVNSAKRILRSNPLSRSMLISTLEDRGYSNEVAVYGVDNCGADWNEQATKKAQALIKEHDYSREQLQAQLQSTDGFTEEQAEYGVSSVSDQLSTEAPKSTDVPPEYNNAVNSAKRIQKSNPLSKTALISILKDRGYSNEVAIYGADNCGADWYEQATKKAQKYIEASTYSKEELVVLLENDGFTKEQAEYGASST